MPQENQRRYEITAIEPDEFNADMFSGVCKLDFDVKILRDGTEHAGKLTVSGEVIIVLNPELTLVRFDQAEITEEGQEDTQSCEGFFSTNDLTEDEPVKLVAGTLFVSGEK